MTQIITSLKYIITIKYFYKSHVIIKQKPTADVQTTKKKNQNLAQQKIITPQKGRKEERKKETIKQPENNNTEYEQIKSSVKKHRASE